jgi:predicted membrane channel-forming protein YqfA (hemolysin III family)
MLLDYWPIVLIVTGVIVYVAAKVLFYMRKSERQWRQVDKSKLKDWEDDEW